MAGFLGFLDQGVGGPLLFVIRDANGVPVEPDAAPTYRVYGANGLVANGTGAAASFETGAVTGASNASPVVITSVGHGLTTGQRVTIAGVLGNTAANGTWTVTKVDADHFSLNGSAGNGGYTSGGTWRTTGLYAVTLASPFTSGLGAGTTYSVELNYSVSSSARLDDGTFTVR